MLRFVTFGGSKVLGTAVIIQGSQVQKSNIMIPHVEMSLFIKVTKHGLTYGPKQQGTVRPNHTLED
jgi:hypothetical protein